MSQTDALAPPPPVLTPELATKLLAGAQTGMFLESVAEGCGLPPEVLEQWLTMGLSSGAVEPYRTFSRQYRAVEKVAQLAALAAWQAAAATDWRAAERFLAVRYPKEFGPKANPRQAGDLQPTMHDEAMEEAMVEALFDEMPPVLARILERKGLVKK